MTAQVVPGHRERSQVGGELVSVVIPTYGRRANLFQLVQDLLVQETQDFTHEILVIDDGSPDPVEPVLEAALPATDVLVRCLRKPNGGAASARNHGAAAARGEWLVFLDDDVGVAPDFLRGHLQTQRRHGPALVNYLLHWEVGASPPPFAQWYEACIERWARGREAQMRPIAPEVFTVPHAEITAANLSLPRATFLSLGGFDTGYRFPSCEDQDLALRFELAGYPALIATTGKVIHRETHNTLDKVCSRQQRGSAETVRFVRRFAIATRFGEPSIARSNNPVQFGTDPWGLIVKKVARSLLATGVGRAIATATIRVLESACPRTTWLPRLYDLMVAACIQAGWREGLRRYAAVSVLDGILGMMADEVARTPVHSLERHCK